MSFAFQAEFPPLRSDPDGTIRVGNTRVLLEILLSSFQRGSTPEQIVQQFPSLSLSDTYSTIAYYLRHREALDEYLRERERLGDEMERRVRKMNRADPKLAEIRARMEARRQAQG